jgi:ABC-2 type transport system ATP-binding protein
VLFRSNSEISKKKQIDDIVEVTGLIPEQNKKIGSLSKGFRQRVGLAQALIHNPGVLILDEATTGLDPNQIVEIRNLIKEAGKKKTVLLSTHIMQEVEAICDRVIIIDKGVIVANEVKSNINSIIKHPKQIITIEFDKAAEESSLRGISNVCSVEKIKNNSWLIEASGDEDIRSALFSFAVSNNLTVLSLQKQESNLEEIFRHLTGG